METIYHNWYFGAHLWWFGLCGSLCQSVTVCSASSQTAFHEQNTRSFLFSSLHYPACAQHCGQTLITRLFECIQRLSAENDLIMRSHKHVRSSSEIKEEWQQKMLTNARAASNRTPRAQGWKHEGGVELLWLEEKQRGACCRLCCEAHTVQDFTVLNTMTWSRKWRHSDDMSTTACTVTPVSYSTTTLCWRSGRTSEPRVSLGGHFSDAGLHFLCLLFIYFFAVNHSWVNMSDCCFSFTFKS